MVILVMGVTGAGKTTVGKLLAQQLDWQFLDADDFHPPENIEKMKHGIPLTDADREPWLAAIHKALLDYAAKNQNVVLACSALKQKYREKLAAGLDLRICYLKGSFEEISSHIEHRTGHFAGEAILAGQFADLEEPDDAVVLDATVPPEENVNEGLTKLHLVPQQRG
jgi:gluconokinase